MNINMPVFKFIELYTKKRKTKKPLLLYNLNNTEPA